MLRSLYIKNYALIEEFTVQFDRGLNIITGETGAGKSIILGAFSLLIGERASSEMIRTGADKAVVEAEFDLHDSEELKAFLDAKEFDTNSELLIVRREISTKGSARGFVNDSPTTAQLLKELGTFLVDLHGQHEHQSLLRAEGHIGLLDNFGGLQPEVDAFRDLRATYVTLLQEVDDLRKKQQRLEEERDLLDYQRNEIEQLDPKPQEDEKIEEELKLLENAEELRTTATSIYETLYDAEGSAYEKLSKAKQELDRLARIDPSLKESVTELQSALVITAELSKSLSYYSDNVEFQPERLSTLRERAQALVRLKKKYGGSLDAVLVKLRDLRDRLGVSESVADSITRSETELQRLRRNLSERAFALSEKRRKVARKLEPEIGKVLKELGIEHGKFAVRFTERELAESEKERAAVLRNGTPLYSNAHGIDLVEFFISTNAGEEPKPLVKVASGGEISRIMLSLKTILAQSDRLPLLVFDEIDVGVSGRIAQRVGRAMKRLAQEHQIIAISHLAQIAAFADAHYLVQKTTSAKSTSSRLRLLTAEEHIDEVARLISGADVSPTSRLAAEELLREANALIASA